MEWRASEVHLKHAMPWELWKTSYSCCNCNGPSRPTAPGHSLGQTTPPPPCPPPRLADLPPQPRRCPRPHRHRTLLRLRRPGLHPSPVRPLPTITPGRRPHSRLRGPVLRCPAARPPARPRLAQALSSTLPAIHNTNNTNNAHSSSSVPGSLLQHASTLPANAALSADGRPVWNDRVSLSRPAGPSPPPHHTAPALPRQPHPGPQRRQHQQQPQRQPRSSPPAPPPAGLGVPHSRQQLQRPLQSARLPQHHHPSPRGPQPLHILPKDPLPPGSRCLTVKGAAARRPGALVRRQGVQPRGPQARVVRH